eukprot:scaffold11153_cov125-Isochrysis_galbana.AAC.12
MFQQVAAARAEPLLLQRHASQWLDEICARCGGVHLEQLDQARTHAGRKRAAALVPRWVGSVGGSLPHRGLSSVTVLAKLFAAAARTASWSHTGLRTRALGRGGGG